MPRAVLAKDVLQHSGHHALYINQHAPLTPGHPRGSSMRFMACPLYATHARGLDPPLRDTAPESQLLQKGDHVLM